MKKNENKNSEQNPYLNGAAGRKEWNDRYGNMRSSIKLWQAAFFGALTISIVFSLVIAKMACASSVQPFIVETNNGMPYAVKSMKTISTDDQKLINFALNQFIVNARTVINDAQAQKLLLNKVYAYSANQTIGFLHDYYQKNSPFEISKEYSVAVNIIHSLPISKHTWQITWDEEKRNHLNGSAMIKTRWVANVSFQFADVNQHFITDNPFGFYVTQINWSQSQNQ